MHLRTVELRDWKAYENARFDFPPPADGRNVILIGGRNGFGKTSFFEALILGLYGRDGITLILRAAAAADESGRARSYGEFMQRALNGGALAAGRAECRIRLTFEDEGGEPIVIERKWFFSDNGRPRQGGGAEEVRILEGAARRPVAPPRSEPEPEAWYRDWISRHFLPTHLAGFFLFDGEASSAFAERSMDQQVRTGIEGLLGLTWLRKLQTDLRAYAGAKRRELPPHARQRCDPRARRRDRPA
jgi:DNA sulfur modification protein DndD